MNDTDTNRRPDPDPDGERNADTRGATRALGAAWEARARSPYRDFFVSSQLGWSQRDAWVHQALHDLRGLFRGVPADALPGLRVLEIGCGVGRLAEQLAPRIAQYDGVDIAPSMVAEASERCSASKNARFFAAPGSQLPPEVREESYDFVYSLAVLIHLPRSVVVETLRSAWARVAPGGQLRVQLRADANDPTRLEPPPALAEPGPFDGPASIATSDDVRESLPRIEQLQEELATDIDYMGEPWTVEALRGELERLGIPVAHVLRMDPQFVYVVATR